MTHTELEALLDGRRGRMAAWVEENRRRRRALVVEAEAQARAAAFWERVDTGEPGPVLRFRRREC